MEFQKNNEDEAVLEEVENEGINNVKRCLQKLYYIWDDFGIDKGQKSHRAKSVWVHILNLVKDILEEEASLHKETAERIENYKIKIKELSSILSVIPKEISEASLIKKEELLSHEFENLCQLKNKQIETYQDLKNTELEYCQILNLPGHKLIHDSGIPTEKDINEIKHHIEILKEEKHKRLKRLSLMKKELKAIWEATELAPETSLEKEIFSAVETFSLSNETFQSLEEVIGKVHHKRTELEVQKKNLLRKLTILWERLQIDRNEREEFLSSHSDCRLSALKSIEKELERCEKIKMEKIEMFIDSLQKELNELWDKCHISEAVRQEFKYSSITALNDKALEAYESEVEKMKKYYEDVEHILKNILKREEFWNLKTVLENKAADPNRFKNRRGNLLQEERERKKLQKDLPILENIIIKDIEEYEALNNCKFLYDGEDYRKLIINKWSEKESEKPHKNFGLQLRPVARTPGKRPPSAVPKSAPSKLLRSNAGVPLTCTPSTQPCKILPSTVGKCVGQHLCKGGDHAKNVHKKSQKMVLKERNQSDVVEMKGSPNGTTYTHFANELNSPARHCFRSSVLATRKPSGSRISKKSCHCRKKNAVKSSRRSIRLSSSNVNCATSSYSN
ncbi:Protein regulator of cytokinesis 1 [Araneus ventricosus]|uniref:Protein regulator of cytokinesis 1 n=1 Tax=Araneus ventricosus TaxID=182803 RepID=A0A4Y2FHJ4_ARAVE|nr:Protein regulator of cytokinesis 1 [Araneus ventricosus]